MAKPATENDHFGNYTSFRLLPAAKTTLEHARFREMVVVVVVVGAEHKDRAATQLVLEIAVEIEQTRLAFSAGLALVAALVVAVLEPEQACVAVAAVVVGPAHGPEQARVGVAAVVVIKVFLRKITKFFRFKIKYRCNRANRVQNVTYSAKYNVIV